jgi:ubiquinone/menaquinone biosynthesis C-methylase UbiE
MEKQNPQDHKQKSKNHFDTVTLHYSDTYEGKYAELMHDAVMQELEGKKFATLLDVGCGTGSFLSKVSNKFDVKVSGIDISPGMIEKSRELLGGQADLRVGDSEHLPWNDRSFDIVTCIASFHHFPSPVLVLKEMERVLRQGGSLIIADPWAPDPWRYFANLIIRSPLNRGGDVRVYSRREMEELMGKRRFASMKWKMKGHLWRKYFIATALRE